MEQTRRKNKAPTIEPRKNADGSDYYRIRLQVNGKREQFTFNTLEEAEAKVRELMSERKAPVASNAYLKERREREGFDVIFKKWIENGKATKRLRGSTCYSHTSIYHLLEPIQKLALSEITKERLASMFSSTEWSKLSAATFKHLVSIITNTNEFASEILEIENAIKFKVSKFSKPFRPLEKSREEAVRWLTAQELQIVVTTAYRGAHYEFNGVPKGRTSGKNFVKKRELWLPRWVGPSIVLAANTGLRIGELLGLTWAKVDLTKREIYVHNTLVQDENGKTFFAENRTKTATSRRTISLSENAVEALKQLKLLGTEYEQKFGEATPFVLTQTFKIKNQKNKFLAPHVFRATLKRLFDYLEISGMSPHKLRHTFATIFLSESKGNFDNNARILQDLLGHSTIEMSMFYSHISLGKKANAVKVFDDVSGNLTSKLEDKRQPKNKTAIA